MNLHQLLIKPLLTEKTINAQSQNRYGFLVQKEARKAQISKAVSLLFKVDVTSVRLSRYKPIQTRTGRRRLPGTTSLLKKAYVTLKTGQSISFEEGKV